MNAQQDSPSPTLADARLNEKGRLVVKLTGRDEPVEDARVARCFPWTSPDEYVSIRDAKGNELLLLRSLDEVPPAVREVLTGQLSKAAFTPRIRRVQSVKREFGVTNIAAETDRGETTFQIRSRDDVRMLGPGRALFRDADGVTYELPDFDALDPASRKHLRTFF